MITFIGATTMTAPVHQEAELIASVDVLLNSAWLCTIPAGFRCDGLSRRWWMPRKWGRWAERYRPAWLLHDYLLAVGALNKAQIDWLFMGALRETGVSALEAGVFWLAVRTRRPNKAFRA